MNAPSIFGQPILAILLAAVASALTLTIRWWTTRGKPDPDTTPEDKAIPRTGIIALCLWIMSGSIFGTSVIYALSLDQTQFLALALTEEKLVQIQSDLSLTQTAFAVEESRLQATETSISSSNLAAVSVTPAQVAATPSPTHYSQEDVDASAATALYESSASPDMSETLTTFTSTPELTATPINEECIRASFAETLTGDGVEPEIVYDFEDISLGMDNYWTANEVDFKLADTEISDEFPRCGEQSLKIITELDATIREDIFHHTAPTGYFDRNFPVEVTPEPGAGYDFENRTVQCFVNFPINFPTGEDSRASVYLFVKDRTDKNFEGERLEITEEDIGKWVRLSAFVGDNSEHAHEDFDPRDISAIGIAIITPPNSTLRYGAETHGAIYIDDCTLE